MSRRTKRHSWFRRLSPKVRPVIRGMAASLSRGDRDLADDLEQEGLIAIYMMGPDELCRARKPEAAAAGRAWRAMRRARSRARLLRPCADGGEISGWSVGRLTRRGRP